MTTTNPPVLECSGLQKRYGERRAVDGVGFHIDEGETYGLWGPNGAGKTTTISMICGILEREGGQVTVAGRPLDTDAGEAKASIGYVPQEIALYPDLTGRENLRFFGRLQGLAGGELSERVGSVLAVVGLADRAADRVESYSGGMQRRANIAAGLLHSPKLLVLDEPTVGVDPQSRNAVLETIVALGGEGMAVLYATHYMEDAERLCDRVGIIDEGRSSPRAPGASWWPASASTTACASRRAVTSRALPLGPAPSRASWRPPPWVTPSRSLPSTGGGAWPRWWRRPSTRAWRSAASTWSNPTSSPCSCA